MLGGFRVPTRTTIAPGCLAGLGAAATALGAGRVLLVTDPGLRAAGIAARAEAALRAGGVAHDVFEDVPPNPRTTTAEAIGAACRRAGIQVVVGLGGGSVLDAAKAGAMLATNDRPVTELVGRNRFTARPLPFVAVPTTCGTGSEVTWVAVLTDEAARTKISVKGDAMFPDAALVDPDLLAGLPPALIASTGMDALTHAVEALTVNCANPVSDALAAEAVESIVRALPEAVADPVGAAAARLALARASTLAGMAFGNADVGAVHCLSESIGGRHDLPHGLVNAVLLAPVMASHRPHVDRALARLERRIGGVEARDAEAAAGFIARLEALRVAVGLPAFGALGVPAADRDAICAAAESNGSNGSNPRPMRAADYRAILDAL